MGTQERVLRPLDLPHSGPKHFLLDRGKFEGVFLGTCQKINFLKIDFFQFFALKIIFKNSFLGLTSLTTGQSGLTTRQGGPTVALREKL